MLLQGVGLTYGALAASCRLMSDVGIINGQMPNRKVTWEGPPRGTLFGVLTAVMMLVVKRGFGFPLLDK